MTHRARRHPALGWLLMVAVLLACAVPTWWDAAPKGPDPLTGLRLVTKARSAAWPAQCGSDGAKCLRELTLPGGAKLAAYSNFPMTGSAQVTHAMLVVHGAGRDAAVTFTAMMQAAGKAGANVDHTMVLAPWFKTAQDSPSSGEAVWSSGGWKIGDASTGGGGEPISSFQATDDLLYTWADRAKFPNLRWITVVGHSAGGQFTDRYATFGQAPSHVPGLLVSFVVAYARLNTVHVRLRSMIDNERWYVCFTRRELPDRLEFREWLADWGNWLDAQDIAEDTPFLLSPTFDYDVGLNAFFLSPKMQGAAQNTLDAYARDMAGFFTFLWTARDRTLWRDATEADHLAYRTWRIRELARAGSTWGREVATVNAFYEWAWAAGQVALNPIPQRASKPRPTGAVGARAAGRTPATAPHNTRRDKIEWLPPKSYRQWRDIGVRGYGLDGLPEPGFRGRWAARNAVFCDLMVRTGLRLTEQASLTVFELPRQPTPGGTGYQRLWLPASIAKWGSCRWIYVPVAMVHELALYRDLDRPEAVETGRARGRYNRIQRPLVIEDPNRPEVSLPGQYGSPQRVKLGQLTPKERRRVLVDTSDGLEPAIFWLSEEGTPVAVPTWKELFTQANKRCAQRGLHLRCHPHALRHSFAVVTLEQLQRGHLRELSGMSPAQRTHYTHIFGDPLDWVRRRLGHSSVSVTQVYLHCLAELEMATRMALVPDSWADPRETPLELVGDDHTPPDEEPACQNTVVRA
jgi:site-specific recombinase XerD